MISTIYSNIFSSYSKIYNIKIIKKHQNQSKNTKTNQKSPKPVKKHQNQSKNTKTNQKSPKQIKPSHRRRVLKGTLVPFI